SIQPSYGVVVFNERQLANDEITANFTHIVSKSNTIININNEINNIRENLGNGGGNGGDLPDNYNILGGVASFYMMSDSYMSHQKRNYDPVVDGEYNRETHLPAFNVLVY